MRKIALLSVSALFLAAAAAHAGDTPDKRGWSQPTWRAPFCKLQVSRVYQPNSKQPVHVVLKNVSAVSLRYELRVTARMVDGRTEIGNIRVDNMNKGEQGDKPTSSGFSGTVDTVSLSLVNCEER